MELKFDTEYWYVMEIKNNQWFSINESDWLLKLKKIHCHEIHEHHKDLKCEFCGNSFSEEGTLEKHIHKIHEARKYHNCKCCDNFFSEGGKLKKHIQKVHDNERINVAKQQNIIEPTFIECGKIMPTEI